MRSLLCLGVVLALVGCGGPDEAAEATAAPPLGPFAPGSEVVLCAGEGDESERTVPIFVGTSVNPTGMENVPAGTHAEVVHLLPPDEHGVRYLTVLMTDGPRTGYAARVSLGFARAAK